jgi:hypothetical protein
MHRRSSTHLTSFPWRIESKRLFIKRVKHKHGCFQPVLPSIPEAHQEEDVITRDQSTMTPVIHTMDASTQTNITPPLWSSTQSLVWMRYEVQPLPVTMIEDELTA